MSQHQEKTDLHHFSPWKVEIWLINACLLQELWLLSCPTTKYSWASLGSDNILAKYGKNYKDDMMRHCLLK